MDLSVGKDRLRASLVVFAHRGASGYAPENTFAAFDAAVRLGAHGIETDVRLTEDGVLALLHDESLDRTTDGRGRIARMRWAEVERVDAGRWFAPEFAGERVPRLEAFLERYLGTVRVCLEVKAPEAVGPLVELIAQRGLATHQGLELTSFSRGLVRQLHRALPSLVVGRLTFFFSGALIDRTARSGISRIWPRARSLTSALVVRARAQGLQVIAWDATTRRRLQRVVDAGADGVVLDCPDWIVPENQAPPGQ